MLPMLNYPAVLVKDEEHSWILMDFALSNVPSCCCRAFSCCDPGFGFIAFKEKPLAFFRVAVLHAAVEAKHCQAQGLYGFSLDFYSQLKHCKVAITCLLQLFEEIWVKQKTRWHLFLARHPCVPGPCRSSLSVSFRLLLLLLLRLWTCGPIDWLYVYFDLKVM